jgi:hypothetical protein
VNKEKMKSGKKKKAKRHVMTLPPIYPFSTAVKPYKLRTEQTIDIELDFLIIASGAYIEKG